MNIPIKGNGQGFDPCVQFEVAGFFYHLDKQDTDQPRLWYRTEKNGSVSYEVGMFGAGYDPWEVLLTALRHRTATVLANQRLRGIVHDRRAG